MAQAAVAAPAAAEAAKAGEETANKIAQKAIAFLDQDVFSYSKQKTISRISADGKKEVEETTIYSAGVKVWELGIALLAITIWEGIQIFAKDVSQIEAIGSWVEDALKSVASDAEQGFAWLGTEEARLLGIDISEGKDKKKLPAMPALSAMGVLDAQLGVFFAQTLAPLNLAGGQLINAAIAQIVRKGAHP
jgi:hypothetical protein